MWRVVRSFGLLVRWIFWLMWKLATWFYVAVGFVVVVVVLVLVVSVADGISSLDDESYDEFSSFSKTFGFGDWSDFREPSGLPDRFVVRYSMDDLLGRLDGNVGESPFRYIFSQAMEEMASDERVEGVSVEMGLFRLGVSDMQFLSRAMKPLYEGGKKVYVHGGNILQMTSHALFQPAEEVWISPVGILDYEGYGFEQPYIADLLGVIGLEAFVVKEGRYKSAVDWLSERGATPSEREQVEGLLDSWIRQTEEVSKGGDRLGGESFASVLRGGLYTADEALERGMVDEVGYYSEFEMRVEEAVRGECGEECEEEVAFVDLGDYMNSVHWSHLEEGGEKKRVAYVALEGPIYNLPKNDNYFWGGNVGINALYWKDRLEALGENEEYEGVVVRISSPGGEVGASDEMWWALKRLNEKKPVVVVVGDVAASGGYYMAVAGERIVIERGAITGSIGVVLGFLVQERLSEKVGVNWERFERGRFANLLSPNRYPDDEERELVEKVTGWSYKKFVEKVAEGRGMSYEEVDSLAQGRVWSGEDALLRGLADGEGGLRKAEEMMREILSWDEEVRMELVTVEREVDFQEVLGFLNASQEVFVGLKGVWVEVLHSLGVSMDGRWGSVMMRAG